MSGSRTRFSKYSVSGSPYFVDVESIQIEKNELSCGMFFLDQDIDQDIAKYSLKFCKHSTVYAII